MLPQASTAGSTLRRRQTRELTNPDGDRFIDFGVRIIVVRQDDEGIVPPGTALPRVVRIRDDHYLGGRWDTITCQFIGPCREWTTWLIGEKQYEILFGSDRKQHNLLYSAEGAGKTVLMAQWIWIQIILAATAGIAGNLGATAPTAKRLGTLVKAVTDLAPVGTSREPLPGQWGTLRVDDADIRTVSGQCIQFRSTKQQSAAGGSPIQGWNWGLGVACDELQDSIHAMADIMARLRSGKDAPCMSTATAKDSPEWRTFRDSLAEKYWEIHRLSYLDAWAVHASHWDMLKANCSLREWMRRGLAMDVGPERMVYTTWDRAENLRPVPQIGAKDVTSEVLGRYGRNFTVLCGHDPGQICDVTLVLKAYRIGRDPEPQWWVVDEITTERTTTEEHLVQLVKSLRDKWGTNRLDYHGRPMPDSDRAHVRIDPYGDSDNKTDKSVYQLFRHVGLDARSAAYKQGKGSGRVPKEAGIEMVSRLLCNANGKRRLFVATDASGAPYAPKLVHAIELSERDLEGKAETQRKGKSDLSHWTAALRYALHPLERRPTTLAELGEERS